MSNIHMVVEDMFWGRSLGYGSEILAWPSSLLRFIVYSSGEGTVVAMLKTLKKLLAAWVLQPIYSWVEPWVSNKEKKNNGWLSEHIGLYKWLNFHHTSLMAKLHVGGTNSLGEKECLFLMLLLESYSGTLCTLQADYISAWYHKLPWLQIHTFPLHKTNKDSYFHSCWESRHFAHSCSTLWSKMLRLSAVRDARPACVLQCFLYLFFLLRKICYEIIGIESRRLDLKFQLCHRLGKEFPGKYWSLCLSSVSLVELLEILGPTLF